MGGPIFLAVFLAVILSITVLIFYFRRKIRRFSQEMFGNADIVEALKEADATGRETPRSLSGLDRLLLPKILKDHPDFDVTLAKTYAREELTRRNQGKPDFKIHNVVISQYLRSGAQRTIVFQAATCCRENGQIRQRRYDLYYTYLLPESGTSVAANCPNCGAALRYGETVCPYCESRVANVLGNTWRFTEVRET